jgi:hypothetical protein
MFIFKSLHLVDILKATVEKRAGSGSGILVCFKFSLINCFIFLFEVCLKPVYMYDLSSSDKSAGNGAGSGFLGLRHSFFLVFQ